MAEIIQPENITGITAKYNFKEWGAITNLLLTYTGESKVNFPPAEVFIPANDSTETVIALLWLSNFLDARDTGMRMTWVSKKRISLTVSPERNIVDNKDVPEDILKISIEKGKLIKGSDGTNYFDHPMRFSYQLLTMATDSDNNWRSEVVSGIRRVMRSSEELKDTKLTLEVNSTQGDVEIIFPTPTASGYSRMSPGISLPGVRLTATQDQAYRGEIIVKPKGRLTKVEG
jgi:hypothetical protein